MNPLQQSIKNPCFLEGFGIHSGKPSRLFFRPARENTGIIFIKNGSRLKACAENVISTQRGTNLPGIQTIEHVLAAAYGLGIDNLEIEILGDEPPAADGSALPYVNLLKDAGIIPQGAPKKILAVKESFQIKDGPAQISVAPAERLEIDFVVEFKEKFIGRQKASFKENQDVFIKEIAPARTFGFLRELEDLRSKGLGQGATAANALVIKDDGYLSPLRFENELARHKILDLLGDLCLLEYRLQASLTCFRSGHKLNLDLVKSLLKLSLA